MNDLEYLQAMQRKLDLLAQIVAADSDPDTLRRLIEAFHAGETPPDQIQEYWTQSDTGRTTLVLVGIFDVNPDLLAAMEAIPGLLADIPKLLTIVMRQRKNQVISGIDRRIPRPDAPLQ